MMRMRIRTSGRRLMQQVHQTRDQLERLTRDELRELAKGAGIKGFGSMRKSELILALTAEAAEHPPSSESPRKGPTPPPSLSPEPVVSPAPRVNLRNRRLATEDGADDALELEPLDSRWLRTSWIVSCRSLDRVVAAMGASWHLANPALRLYRVTCDEAGPRSKTVVQDLAVPVDVRQWFLNTPVPGGHWQVELGYLARDGRFYPLMHSQVQSLPETPRAHKRVLLAREEASFPDEPENSAGIAIRFDVEIHISGNTIPGARVTVEQEAVSVDQHGLFEMIVPATDGRHVLPIEVSGGGHRQRVLMAFERNTRYLEQEVDPEGATGG